MATTKPLRVGVFMLSTVQLLDFSGVDLFGMLDPGYLSLGPFPDAIVKLGVPFNIEYIAMPETGPYIQLTANAQIKVTKSTKDPEVQPGMLDIILVPGPDPSVIFKKEELDFLRNHVAWRGKNGKCVDLLSICTGCGVLAQAGLLKGRRASGPRGLIPTLRKQFPDTTWIDDKRWVIDGQIWSSGGVTNGQEMVAAYMRENFPGPATETVLAMAEVGDKGIDYASSSNVAGIWWLWTIFRAFAFGNGKRKKM